MNTKTLISLLLISLTAPTALLFSQVETTHQTTSLSPVQLAAQNTERLLSSLVEGDRDLFLKNGSKEFQDAMTTELFGQAREKLGPILNQPSQLDYLGSLHKGQDVVYLYRLRPDAGGNDSLVSTAMRQGVVTGFFVN